jgi:hypothetical protein
MARRLPSIGVAVLVAAGLALPATASAAPADQVTIPVDFTTYSLCPDAGGEAVHFTGSMRLVHIFTTDTAGGYHEIFKASSHYVGVGLDSGDRYVSNNTDVIVGEYPTGGTSVVVNLSRYRTDATGNSVPDGDFSLRMMFTPGGYYVEDQTCS